MLDLLKTENLAILILIAWVVESKRINMALTKSNEAAWATVGKLTEAIYKIAGKIKMEVTGGFYVAPPQD